MNGPQQDRWPLLSTLPASNIRILFLAALDAASFVLVAWSIHAHPLAMPPALEAWLALLLALHGVQTGAKAVDRVTDYGYVERKGAAEAAKAAAPTQDHPVVVVAPAGPIGPAGGGE